VPATGPIPNIVGIFDEGVAVVDVEAGGLAPVTGLAVDVFAPKGSVLAVDSLLALSAFAAARNWLPPEFRPETSFTLPSTFDSLVAWLTYPFSVVANWCAKEFDERLELAELGIRLASGSFTSALAVTETMF
jgi:hypothetical protein